MAAHLTFIIHKTTTLHHLFCFSFPLLMTVEKQLQAMGIQFMQILLNCNNNNNTNGI